MEQKTYIDHIIDFAWNYGPRVLIALILFFGGLWLIKRLTRGFDQFLRARRVDVSLRPFFTSTADMAMKVALLIVVAGRIGIETTSFIAVFSAIAFSVGLALQGSLGNFASGVLILLFRPYKVGDLLTVSGKSGRVTEIQIFNTILLTDHGKKIIIPNGKMTEGPIENIQENVEIQAEITLLVDSETPLENLRALAAEVVAQCPWALHDKASEVKIAGITRDDMKVQISCWIMGEHYIDTLPFLYESIQTRFETAGVKLAKERRRENI